MSCYYKQTEDEELQGLLGVYVDDTLAAGTEKFKKLTDNIEKHFESKPRDYLPFQFAGINIKKKENGYIMEQEHYVPTITKLEKTSTFETFRTTRHRLAWISHTRPEILAGVNILAQVTKDTFQQEDITITNSLIKHIHKNPELGLQYNKMDIETMEILVYSDGSFSGNNDGSSQVGFMNFLIDKNNTASLIEYSSSKSKRIVRSVLGAETFGMADACDASIVLQHDIKKITGRNMKIRILTDSETLFNVVIKNASTKEKRLMIDIKAARQAYNEGIISDIIWARRDYNLGDAMTKAKIMPLLMEVMKTGKIKYEIEQSVNRTIMRPEKPLNTPQNEETDNLIQKEEKSKEVSNLTQKEEKSECEN